MANLAEEDLKSIERIHARWIEQELQGNSLAVLELCTEDVKWILPDGRALTSKEAIKDWLVHSHAKIIALRLGDRRIDGLGSVAYLTCVYSTTFTIPEELEEQLDHGQHLWILQKFPSAGWMIAMITWQSNG